MVLNIFVLISLLFKWLFVVLLFELMFFVFMVIVRLLVLGLLGLNVKVFEIVLNIFMKFENLRWLIWYIMFVWVGLRLKFFFFSGVLVEFCVKIGVFNKVSIVMGVIEFLIWVNIDIGIYFLSYKFILDYILFFLGWI